MDVVSLTMTLITVSISSRRQRTQSMDAMRPFFISMGMAQTSLAPALRIRSKTYSMF